MDAIFNDRGMKRGPSCIARCACKDPDKHRPQGCAAPGRPLTCVMIRTSTVLSKPLLQCGYTRFLMHHDDARLLMHHETRGFSCIMLRKAVGALRFIRAQPRQVQIVTWESLAWYRPSSQAETLKGRLPHGKNFDALLTKQPSTDPDRQTFAWKELTRM
eukprot:scaffold140536_cov20-Tisochrysis_lutea.AAC.1